MAGGVEAHNERGNVFINDAGDFGAAFAVIPVEHFAHQTVVRINTGDDGVAGWYSIGRAGKRFRQRHLNGDGFDFIDFHLSSPFASRGC